MSYTYVCPIVSLQATGNHEVPIAMCVNVASTARLFHCGYRIGVRMDIPDLQISKWRACKWPQYKILIMSRTVNNHTASREPNKPVHSNSVLGQNWKR